MSVQNKPALALSKQKANPSQGMYKIIGADQLEYGPVTLEELRGWIVDGRVNSQTKLRVEDRAEWKMAQDVPELADALASSKKASIRPGPPPLPGVSTPTAQTSAMAVWSLVLGVVGLMTCGVLALITGPIGLVLGIVGMNRIQKSHGALRGRGVALTGSIVCGVSLLLLPVMAGMLLPALAKAKAKAQGIQCMNNLKQLSLAARMYASDNKDHFPEASTWCDALQAYLGGGRPFKCPAGHSGDQCDYAFNTNLAGIQITNYSPNTVLIFEAEGGWNNSGDQDAILRRPRHGRAIGVAFTDGHIEQVSEARLRQLRWSP
jgi:prepilin-type processing-associated H-X9-DG protein